MEKEETCGGHLTLGPIEQSYVNLLIPKPHTYIKEIEAKSPNSWADKASTRHCLLLSEISSARSGIHVIELLGEEARMTQILPRLLTGWYPQTDGKALFYLNHYIRLFNNIH